jgi:heat shock protein HslJ
MRALIVLLFAGVLVVGLTPSDPARAQTFSSTVWQLQSLEDEPTYTPSSRYSVEFLADGTVRIEADCNSASGTWTFPTPTPGSVDITITLTAVAGCPSPSWESTFLDRLEEANRFEIDSKVNTLTLFKDDQKRLVFQPAVA